MKAAITKTYGPANVIEIQEVPKPTIQADEVLVEVHASPVTEGDRRLRSADFPGVSALPGRLMMGITGPRANVQGTMFAGRVVEIGEQVRDYAVGDDVFGSVDHGAYAEFVAVPESGNMARIPEGVSYAEAAATPYGAVTALLFLRDIAKVNVGDRVLVVGASGGVGRFAVQIANHFGAEVTGVCSTENIEFVRSLGAVDVIDYTEEDFTENGKTYDVIFDIADATSFSKSRNSLADGGRYLTLFISVSVMIQMFVTALFGTKRAKFGVALGNREVMQTVRKMLADGVIRVSVAEEFSLDQIVDAHQLAETGRLTGCVIVARRSERGSERPTRRRFDRNVRRAGVRRSAANSSTGRIMNRWSSMSQLGYGTMQIG